MAISDMKTKETMEKRITESFRNGDESSYYYRFEYYFLTGLDKSNRSPSVYLSRSIGDFQQ